MAARNLWTTILYTLGVLVFALWLGGFTFYAAVVVPVGTDVLGSAAAQGLVTRRVAPWINGLSDLCAVLLMGWVVLKWAWLGNGARTLLLACGLTIAGLSVVQWMLYPEMSSLVDAAQVEVRQSERFYFLHRIYLWAAAGQWLAALTGLCFAVHGLKGLIAAAPAPQIARPAGKA